MIGFNYRTRTYIAGDWTGDKNLIDKLYEWNNSDYWALHFIDAHELTQSKDTSMYCTIKRSLSERLSISKTFVLIVGEKTNALTKGGCQNCRSYNSWTSSCTRGYYVDYRSYIAYECERARNDELKIVVIYNYASVHKEKCPEILRKTGIHLPAYYYVGNSLYWNYQAIKDAIM